MDYINYYSTTLLTASKKLIPFLFSLGIGYLLFFKLPFLVFKKNLKKESVGPENQGPKVKIQKDPKKQTHHKRCHQENKKKSKNNSDNFYHSDKTESEKRKPDHHWVFAEKVFKVQGPQNQRFLKRRYLELMKENHPDKVANKGEEFKILAEKRTKDINKAYEILLTRAKKET